MGVQRGEKLGCNTETEKMCYPTGTGKSETQTQTFLF